MRTRRHAGVEPLTSKEFRLKEYILRNEFQKGYSPFSPGLMPYSAPLNYTGSIGGTEVTLTPRMDLMLHMGGNIFSPLVGGETDTAGGYGQVDIPDGKQICTLKEAITLSFTGLAAGNYFIVAFGTIQDENPIVKDVPSLNYPGSGVLQQHRDFYGVPHPDGTLIPRSDYDQSLVDRPDAEQTVTEMVSRVGTAIVLEGDEGADETPLIKVVWNGTSITDISVVVKIVTIAQDVTVDYLIYDADYSDGANYKDYRGQDLADIIIAKEHPTSNRKITLGERDHGTVVVIKSTPTINANINSPDSKPIAITDEIWEAEGEDGSFTNVNVKAGAGDSVLGVEVRTWEFVQLVFIEGLGWHRLNDSAELWSLIDDANTRIDGVDTRIDGVDTRIDGVDTRIDGIDTRIDGVDTRIDGIDTRIDGVDQRITDLRSPITLTFDALQMMNHMTGDQSVRLEVGDKYRLMRFPTIECPPFFHAYLDSAAILNTYGNKLFRFGIEFDVVIAGGDSFTKTFRHESAFDATGKLYLNGDPVNYDAVGTHLRSPSYGNMRGLNNSILNRDSWQNDGNLATIQPFLTVENVGTVATESDWQREHALVPDTNFSGTNIGQPNFILSFMSIHLVKM